MFASFLLIVIFLSSLYFSHIVFFTNAETSNFTSTRNSKILNSSTNTVSLILPNNTKLLMASKSSSETDDSKSLSVKDIFVSSLAAVSAIAGGFLGAHYTYSNSRKIEVYKDELERVNENAFNERIKNLVLYELKAYSNLLETILTSSKRVNEQDSSSPRRVDSSDLSSIKVLLHTHPKNYVLMSIERKAKVFNAESLGKVEAAYQAFDQFFSLFEKSSSSQGVVFKEVELTDSKKTIDNAVDSIK
jgi:hypothetical protein